MVPLTWYLVLAAILFAIGLYGFLARRNMIVMFLCVELMLNAVNLNLVAASRFHHDLGGQVFTFFVIAVAAAEAAIGLAILLVLYRNRRSVDSDAITSLKG